MTHEDAFIAAVIATPDDDGPRLAYADWLMESADPVRQARGEMIKVQCELAQLDQQEHPAVGGNHPRLGTEPRGMLFLGHERCDICQRMRTLVWQDHQLRNARLKGMTNENLWAEAFWDVRDCQWAWRRGFVEAITLPLASWVRHGKMLVRVSPLKWVGATDEAARNALRQGERWGESGYFWAEDDLDRLLPTLHDWMIEEESQKRDGIPDVYARWWASLHEMLVRHTYLRRFGSREEALRAMSDAMLAWARLPDQGGG